MNAGCKTIKTLQRGHCHFKLIYFIISYVFKLNFALYVQTYQCFSQVLAVLTMLASNTRLFTFVLKETLTHSKTTVQVMNNDQAHQEDWRKRFSKRLILVLEYDSDYCTLSGSSISYH